MGNGVFGLGEQVVHAGCAALVAGDVADVPNSQLLGHFGRAGIVAEQYDIDLGLEARPAGDGVFLNDREMSAEGLGRGKERNRQIQTAHAKPLPRPSAR